MSSIRPDIGYLPTPRELVGVLLALANINEQDIIYDLGCGDGRVLITAAQRFGARGVGIDIDPKRIQEAQENAKIAGVSNQIEYRQGNLFETDLREATVVYLYLLPHLNLRLRPQLLSQLVPGTRILSRDFDMGDWQPQRILKMYTSEEEATLYYWIISE